MAEEEESKIPTGIIIGMAIVAVIALTLLIVAALYTAKLKGVGNWRYPASIAATVFTLFFPLFGIAPPILYATQ